MGPNAAATKHIMPWLGASCPVKFGACQRRPPLCWLCTSARAGICRAVHISVFQLPFLSTRDIDTNRHLSCRLHDHASLLAHLWRLELAWRECSVSPLEHPAADPPSSSQSEPAPSNVSSDTPSSPFCCSEILLRLTVAGKGSS